MDHETNHQTSHQFRRLPKGERLPKSERRVRFADSMGMELVSIFLIDLISNYYFASIISHQSHTTPISSNLKSITCSNSQKNQQQQQQQQQQRRILTTTHQQQQHQLNESHKYHYQYNSHYEQKQYPQQQNHHHQQQYQSSQYLYSCNQAKAQQQQQQQQPSSQQQQYPSYICDFTQPISLVSFKERVKMNKVHLETCSVDSRAGNISILCTIRVLNQSFDKSVIVRYTTDEWHTYIDCLASYKPGSCDGWSDKFTTTLNVRDIPTDRRIIFAVRYTFGGDKVHWDNNGGLNYVIKKL